nr:DNA cross-link repair 1A protein [Cryptococcus depauperatus CBS 7841]
MAPVTNKRQVGLQQGILLNFLKKETTTTFNAELRKVTNVGMKSKHVETALFNSKLSSLPEKSTMAKMSCNCDGKGKGKAPNGSINDPVVISDDDDIQPVLYSSSPKRRKIDTEIVDHTPSQLLNKATTTEYPSPFIGYPDYKAPLNWPQVINTASTDDALDEEKYSDEDNMRTQDPEEDEIEDDSGVEMDELSFLPLQRPTPVRDEYQRKSSLNESGWEEPEDEGMGMENEDYDERPSSLVKIPPVKREHNSASARSEKVEVCFVCGMPLKDKTSDIIQHHINQCLDTSTATASLFGDCSSEMKYKAARSIPYYRFSTPPSPPSISESSARGPDAFSLLMSGHKERKQWKDAEDDLRKDGKRTTGRRKAPFYKVMTGMPVAVDAFRYGKIPGVTAYLLTHAHSDHYTNLSKSWNNGRIYCSQTTANLIIHKLEVNPKWVHGLPNDVAFEMPHTGGVMVTPIEANHCPGSSIFLFEGPQTVNAGDSGFASPYVGSKKIFRYLHCGDFRANPKMILHPAIARAPIDTCYLDTTYLNPKYCFPPQPLVINACASLARRMTIGIAPDAPSLAEVQSGLASGLNKADKVKAKNEDGSELEIKTETREDKGKYVMSEWLVKKEEGMKTEIDKKLNEAEKKKSRTLVVIGTYSIGKERIVKAVARALNTKIYCDQRKRGILLCQTDPELHQMLSSDPFESQVHLLPLGNIQLEKLHPYLTSLHPHFDRVLAFRPTGWSYSPPAGADMMPDVNTVIRRDQARKFTDADLKTMRGSCPQFMLYGIPYSEHSSFFELTCFALSLPGSDVKLIATVNVGNEKSRGKMKRWFEKWLVEKAKRKEKGLSAVIEFRDETYVGGFY